MEGISGRVRPYRRGTVALDFRILHLVATVIDACGRSRGRGPGRPPKATTRLLATPRRFLREGTP
jgi:hypothetical protein